MRFLFIFDELLFTLLAITLVVSLTGWLSQPIIITILIVLNIFSAIPLLIDLVKALKERKISVETLALVALLLSAIYREWYSMVFINLMLTSARLLDNYVSDKGRKAVQSLMKLKPESAHLIADGKIYNVLISEIKKKDRIAVYIGEGVPVDGIIFEGEGEFNQASLTGESAPVYKKVGDKVFSAAILVSGGVSIETTEVGQETVLEKMIAMVESAGKNKAAVIGVVDKFTFWYLIGIGIGAIVSWVIFRDLKMILAFMLVACADDIAVAVPLAFTASLGNAAKKGIIIKGGIFIEKLNQVKKIFLDKTGTLTEGKMAFVGELVFRDDLNATLAPAIKEMLDRSTHPISKAVAEHLVGTANRESTVSDLKETGGKGIEAVFQGKKLFLGKLSYVCENGCVLDDKEKAEVDKALASGSSTMFVAFDGRLVGVYFVSDKLRKGAKSVIAKLKENDKQIVVLTGDNEAVAKSITEQAGISSFKANLLPEDKVKFINEASKSETVAMIGDGVNDAAALAASNVGIAMGGIGSDISIETSDVVLMRDNLTSLPDLINLARGTMQVVRQNFIIWFAVNAFGIFLVFARIISPTEAAAYNFVTDFFPLINSLRLFGGDWYFLMIGSRARISRR